MTNGNSLGFAASVAKPFSIGSERVVRRRAVADRILCRTIFASARWILASFAKQFAARADPTSSPFAENDFQHDRAVFNPRFVDTASMTFVFSVQSHIL